MFIFNFKTYSRQECVPNTVCLDEHTIYGSKRLGVRNYPQPGRNLNSADYKFGYNGKEKGTMNEEKPREKGNNLSSDI